MKKIILLLLLIVSSFQGFSQTPGISYQAVILNPNVKELPGINAQSSILANSNVAIRFTIFNNANNQEYQEYHQTKTDAYGMINLLIGHGTKISSSNFNDIIWDGLSKKLKVEIDFKGAGNNYTFLSEQELTFMPQPALSENTEAILNNTNDIVAERNRAMGVESSMSESFGAEIDALTEADAIIQADIDIIKANMGTDGATISTAIAAIQADVDANEVATNTALDLKANIASPSFTGIPLAPTAAAGTSNNQIATTQFVTSFGANYLPLTGGTLTGGLSGVTGKFSSGLEAISLGLKNGTSNWEFSLNSSSLVLHQGGCCNRLTIDDDGNFGIGANYIPSYKLDVEGDGRFTDSVIGNSFVKAGGTASQFLKADGSVDATAYASLNSPTFTGTVSGITKSMVGLGNADDTSDADKPVSTAAQTALDLKANLASPTFTGVPLAPTAAAGTNTTQIATTAFVNSVVSTATANNSNYVTLNTAQTITGAKTFTRNIKLFAQSYANTALMNIGFAPIGENLSGISMGIDALKSYQYGTHDIAIGNEALYNDLRGTNNIAMGYRALYNVSSPSGVNDWGNNNVAIGAQSGFNLVDGDYNTLIGTNSNTSTGDITNGIAIGYGAVVNANNTIQLGNGNITDVKTSGAITSGGVVTGTSLVKSGGTSSQFLKADGSVDVTEYAALNSPTFTGIPLAPTATVGTNTTQIATTAFVANAVSTATSGNFVDLTTNQTIAGVKRFSSDAEINGVTVGRGNFNENSNTAIGLGALGSNAGYANTGIGRGALAVNVDGGGNTALGYIALSNNISGTDNVAIGTQALATNSTGSQNTAIGKHADVASDGISNSVAIGANAIVTASNTIQLGSDGSGSHAAITSVKTSGNITAASYIKAGGTSSQFLMADGSVSTGASAVREVADEFSATASQTSFTLTQTPSASSKVKMYINGIRISNTAYSTSGTTFTYVPASNGGYTLTAGDRIQMDYYY
ncbi:beta strand repeat-containing protein [Confluentibacter sediminis]|uniref:beta strand repeat-containing protein n=1 Tax=Confluentibacter sediminis TaxID=2219045 RepID=UPI000DAD1AE2|nr:hypothetical protein [Confluentibacter sediminis]